MRFSTARSLTLATLVPVLVLALVAPGCAKQSEGERCGDSIGAGASDDCGDGLTCTSKDNLLHNETHRCCYTDHVSDSRCDPKDTSATPSGGASSGGSGSGGGTATAGALESGSPEEAGAGS